MVFLSVLVACSEYELDAGTDPNGVGGDTIGGVTGDGAPIDREIADEFQVPSRVDVLVFGDTSSSMEPELQTMAANVERFVARLAETRDDWQLMAVTGPDGCSTTGVLRPSDGDFAERFATGIMTPPGPDLVDEWGLNNAMAAIDKAAPGECNEGFVRDDSLLHVIFISDEDDNSPGYENRTNDPSYWRQYTDAIRSAKGNADVAFSAVGGPEPDGCEGAEPAYGYWEAVRASEGQFISICDDWAAQIETLADVASTEDTFALSQRPLPSSIVVYDNGVERPGWTYDDVTNAVVFSTNAPIAGDHVVVEYDTPD